MQFLLPGGTSQQSNSVPQLESRAISWQQVGSLRIQKHCCLSAKSYSYIGTRRLVHYSRIQKPAWTVYCGKLRQLSIRAICRKTRPLYLRYLPAAVHSMNAKHCARVSALLGCSIPCLGCYSQAMEDLSPAALT